ncbi:hypothetical protein NKG05_23430 [Oerskovia sp. M15]
MNAEATEVRTGTAGAPSAAPGVVPDVAAFVQADVAGAKGEPGAGVTAGAAGATWAAGTGAKISVG